MAPTRPHASSFFIHSPSSIHSTSPPPYLSAFRPSRSCLRPGWRSGTLFSPPHSSQTSANFWEISQLPAALGKSQLQALTGVEASWKQGPLHLRNMDDETLRDFQGLGLDIAQEHLGKNAGRSESFREAEAAETYVEKETIKAEAVASPDTLQESRWNQSSHIPFNETPPYCPSGSASRAPDLRDVGVNASQFPPGQGLLFPLQASNLLRYPPNQTHPPERVTGQYHLNLRPEAPPFVPGTIPSTARQPKFYSFAPGQKRSLSVFHHRGHPSYRIDKVFRSTTGPAPHTPPAHSGRWTALLSPTVETFSYSRPSSRAFHHNSGKHSQELTKKYISSDEMIQVPAPKVTEAYLTKATIPPTRVTTPQTLLLVLDLNGTLLSRTSRNKNYVPRPGLPPFLDYCFKNHRMLIWSSARPHNVARLCKSIFTESQRGLLLGQWGRDTLGLTPQQYEQRVQVYKDLNTVWQDITLQSRHPEHTVGEMWGQNNTVLVDDSALKAAAQPFNHLEVPEFVTAKKENVGGEGVLAGVAAMLEEARGWSDVSAFMRKRGQVRAAERGNFIG